METIVLENNQGMKAILTNFGARLMSLFIQDKNGLHRDVVLGFNHPEDYLNAEEKYFGCIVGRYANRIADGKFSIANKTYHLACNNGPNSLHGGIKGFHLKTWSIISQTKDSLTMSCISEDGEEGFPGRVEVEVHYNLTDDNALHIAYTAQPDKATPINLTHHSYFNLKGHDQGSVLEHELQINAHYYSFVNENLIPTGPYAPVEGTPFDFRKAKPLGRDIRQEHPQLDLGNGYDHNFILKTQNSQEIVHAASIYEPKHGIRMDVHTNQPGIQLYTANWLSGNDKGKSNLPYTANTAFCLETQHFPDTPNQENFPNCTIKSGETYQYVCEYRFSTDKKC